MLSWTTLEFCYHSFVPLYVCLLVNYGNFLLLYYLPLAGKEDCMLSHTILITLLGDNDTLQVAFCYKSVTV